MKSLTIVALIFFTSIHLFAQSTFQTPRSLDQLSVGVGGGLDYGGFGAQLIYYPVKSAGVFGGLGYALGGVGFNAGVKYRFIPNKPDARVHPYCMAMYGYNAAIAVLNARHLNKLFYGPSVGVGIDLHPKTEKIGYWSFGLLLPFRSQDVNDYIDVLERDHGADFQSGLFPLGATIGYKFMLMKK